MATSLSAQLQGLRVPQTKTLLDVKYRTSILFDRKEAAKKDRRAIYEIGLSGLKELILLNPSFQQFQGTLFEEGTLHLERSVEQSEVNELLDQNINKFLLHLSPYFLLRPAQMCIEWLIRRFYINEYNSTALVLLILPYHDTKIFVRTLQTISLSGANKRTVDWHWLRKLQGAGLSAPISLITNHAATEPSLLSLVCNHTIDVMKTFGANGYVAQAHINLYATVGVGALDIASIVQEKHMLAILPSLLYGLNSKVADFVSASVIIIAELVSRTQLTTKLCTVFVQRLSNISIESLYTTATVVLLTIFEKQEAAKSGSLGSVYTSLINNDWLNDVLLRLCKENVDISPICVYLLESLTMEIQRDRPEKRKSIRFLEQFISDVKLPSTVAKRFISCFLDLYEEPQQEKNIVGAKFIDLDKSDDENNIDFKKWYSNYLYKLQRQYPNEFDQTIKYTFQATSIQSNRELALNMAIGIHLKFADQTLINLYESIYHHTANIRLIAIKTLIKNVSDYRKRPTCYELLTKCLGDRLCHEDNGQVIAVLLNLPTNEFLDILGVDQYLDALISIIHKSEINEEQWKETISLVIDHLTNELVIEQCNANFLLITLMPFILPNGNDAIAVKHIIKIMNSPLVQHIKFMKGLNMENANKNGKFNVLEFKEHFMDALLSSDETPTVEEVIQSIKGRENTIFKNGKRFSHFIMLLTGYLKYHHTHEKTLEIFQYFCKTLDIISQSNSKGKHLLTIDMISSQHLIGDFIVKLIKVTNFEDLRCWTDVQSSGLICYMRIFEWLVNNALHKKEIAEKILWMRLLQDITNIIFTTEKEQIDFLTNFYLYDEFVNASQFNVLRLIAFKLLDNVVQKAQMPLTKEQLLKIFAALSSSSETLRLKALNTLKCVQNKVDASWSTFVRLIIARSYEIGIDEEQFPLVLYTILKTQQKKQVNADRILKDIFELLSSQQHINAQLTTEVLHMLRHINNVDIINKLLPIAEQVLDTNCNEDGIIMLKKPYNRIYEMIIERLDYQTIEDALLHNANAWKLIEKSLKHYDMFLKKDDKLYPLPCFLLNAFDEQIFVQLPNKYKLLLIKEIVETIAHAQNDEIFLAANKFLKKCTIDCDALADILKEMFNKKNQNNLRKENKETKRLPIAPQYDIGSVTWKRGISFLELVDNKKKLKNSHKLIPILFELLRYCLLAEEQALIEYTKQLTLSTINHFIRISQTLNINLRNELPQTAFRVDQIVQCLRSTQNPQTQNNSLLLLSTCANIFPQQVLHNIVDMFTFMGSTVVRHEDAFSFHIITNIIESIIPILLDAGHRSGENDEEKVLAISVLKVFSDIILDVPEHRRLPLYTKLLQTLGSENFLWIFLCIVFEAHVIEEDKNSIAKKKLRNTQNTDERFGKRIEIILEITNCFDIQVIIGTCVQIMNYIQTLPVSKEEVMEIDSSSGRKYAIVTNNTEVTLFDVSCRTSKQLRHYKYIMMQYLSTVTSSTKFLEKIAALTDVEVLQMKPYYQNLIISVLSYVPSLNGAIEHTEEHSLVKYWKIILNHLHDVLENAISILSPNMFLDVVVGLMKHNVLSIRKKVIELLIIKLHRKDEYFDNCDQTKFQHILEPLTGIVDSILVRDEVNATSHDMILLQQNALLAIKLLSKKFSMKFMKEFKELLSKFIQIIKKRKNISKILLASTVLAVVDVSCNLKVHSLAFMPQYMAGLIEVLQEQGNVLQNHPIDSICLSIITGIYKIVETLPLFLAPYIVDIILVLSVLIERISKPEYRSDQRCNNALQKMLTIWTKLANDVPLRILMPSCANAYIQLIETRRYNEIEPLMNLVHETLRNAKLIDLNAMQKDITAFFMETLKFRLYIENDDLPNMDPNRIENLIITAFTTWVLKLSESSFRPLYQTVFEWAFKETETNHIVLITFFRLTTKLSDALKSLFIVFSNNLFEAIGKLLKENNLKTIPPNSKSETVCIELITALLLTLNNIFLYDNNKFISVHRFEVIMQPLVDQFENAVVLTNDSLRKILTSCVAQLAVAVSSDVLWKQLNYQVLLKTRTNVPEVRILAFESCIEIARKLGDDFTTLLPETVPFIAELFEDENPRVEKCTRKLVHDLEGILGESIQKYL